MQTETARFQSDGHRLTCDGRQSNIERNRASSMEARTKMQARPLRRRPTVEILQVDFPADELKQLSWHLSSLPSGALFPSANVFEQPLFRL